MDKEEFTSRLSAMERVLYLTARTLLKSPADCADAMQEAALSAWATLSRLRNADKLEGYVLRILRNRCYQKLRERREVPVERLPEVVEPPPNLALSEALAGLSSEERQLLLWHHDAGYSVREIAQVMHRPEGVIKARLFRARRKLAGLLARMDESPKEGQAKGGEYVG